MSMTPEQREALVRALDFAERIERMLERAGWSERSPGRKLSSGCATEIRAALSQEPEQPISAPAQELYGIRVSPQKQPVSASAIKDPEQPAAEGGMRVSIVGQWYTDGSMVISHGNDENGDLNVADCWDEGTARRIVELHNAAYQTVTAAADPSKKPDPIDTSEPHVDGVDTLANARDAVDYGAISWAYQRLLKFGSSSMDTAMMLDRLNLMLLKADAREIGK